jgi:hypothetical protein
MCHLKKSEFFKKINCRTRQPGRVRLAGKQTPETKNLDSERAKI